ncbi:MAG: hypothetical protein P1U77_24935, partial [Rubripirellula sp.]|nr:hypothetical protein [Rubripirellula sp.]
MALARRIRKRRPSRHSLRLEALEARRVLATYFVNTESDTVGGNCVADDADASVECSIRDAIIAAEATPESDTVEIPEGTYFNNGEGSFDLEQGFDIAFVGTGNSRDDVVIDGLSTFRMFDLFAPTQTNVTFQNLTIQNGVASDGSGGGGINTGPNIDLTVDNVVLQNNVADENSFSPNNFSSGGAIQASGNVTIRDSLIRRNSATRDGGGLHFVPFAAPKTLTISNTVFDNNTAASVGGGILAEGDGDNPSQATVSIAGSVFTNNVGPDSGGGVYIFSSALTVSDSSFSGNSATSVDSGGGGLYVLGTPGTPAFSISDTNFDNNAAVDGAGGLEIANAAGIITGGSYTNNRVTGSASEFNETGRGGGGGIVIIGIDDTSSDGLLVEIDGIQVRGNSAPVAGGIAMVDATVSIANSTIENNTATSTVTKTGAGGIGATRFTGESFLTIERSRINGNDANADAGGIGLIDVDLNLIESTVSGNSANQRAGGIGAVGENLTPTLVLDSSTVAGNTANDVGGGIGAIFAALRMTNTTITQNASQFSGGGIAYDSGDADLTSNVSFSTIAENTALSGGDQVLAQGTSPLTVSNTIFGGNCQIVPGSLVSAGSNLETGLSCGLTDPTDIVDTDPLLAPLQDNGGFVLTHG